MRLGIEFPVWFEGSDFMRLLQSVIPAKAGTQRLWLPADRRHWVPAFAGMTTGVSWSIPMIKTTSGIRA